MDGSDIYMIAQLHYCDYKNNQYHKNVPFIRYTVKKENELVYNNQKSEVATRLLVVFFSKKENKLFSFPARVKATVCITLCHNETK